MQKSTHENTGGADNVPAPLQNAKAFAEGAFRACLLSSRRTERGRCCFRSHTVTRPPAPDARMWSARQFHASAVISALAVCPFAPAYTPPGCHRVLLLKSAGLYQLPKSTHADEQWANFVHCLKQIDLPCLFQEPKLQCALRCVAAPSHSLRVLNRSWTFEAGYEEALRRSVRFQILISESAPPEASR